MTPSKRLRRIGRGAKQVVFLVFAVHLFEDVVLWRTAEMTSAVTWMSVIVQIKCEPVTQEHNLRDRPSR